jgi:hypothetical protein
MRCKKEALRTAGTEQQQQYVSICTFVPVKQVTLSTCDEAGSYEHCKRHVDSLTGVGSCAARIKRQCSYFLYQ